MKAIMSAQWNTQQPSKRMKTLYTKMKQTLRIVQGRDQRAQCAMIYIEKEENVCVCACVYVHLFVDAQNVSGMRLNKPISALASWEENFLAQGQGWEGLN